MYIYIYIYIYIHIYLYTYISRFARGFYIFLPQTPEKDNNKKNKANTSISTVWMLPLSFIIMT